MICIITSIQTLLSIFLVTAQCTIIVQSVVLRLHVIRLSICDVGGSGPHTLEIVKTNCMDNTLLLFYNLSNTFALRSPKAIHLLPGEHGEIWGRLEVGWEKVSCWSTKATISLKCIKLEEKLLWRAYGNSLFRTVPSSIPYGLLSPKIEGSQPPPKNFNHY